MLCLTSPTIRLCPPRDSLSRSSGRKLSHCTLEVSWNSSSRKLSYLTPTFSYMNGASESPIMSLSSRLDSSRHMTFFSLSRASKAE